MPTESEMMQDLAAADAAGDTQLAQHIVGLIKAARAPKVGMGDVQAAPSAFAGTGNVPVGLQTGDPATDVRIAQNLAVRGYRKNLTPGDALRAGAVAAGALVPEALPGVAGAAVSGGLFGGGMSKAQDAAGVALDAAKAFAAAGLGAKLLSALSGRIGSYARGKVAAAAERAAQQSAEAKAAEVASIEGARRSAAANAYRQPIRINEILSDPAVPEAEKAVLRAWQQTPEYADLMTQNARNVLPQAQEALAAERAAADAAAEARANLPEAIRAETARRLSPETAREQVMARVSRYGPPAIGSAVGSAIGGPVGGAIGALGGAGTRPMVHALGRMAEDPAVQMSIWGPLGQLGQTPKPMIATPGLGAELLRLLRSRAPSLLVERVPAMAEEKQP